ncbi:FAD-binding and (Fe-S)-binding domain-containing protein, partial [Aegicerativicinus sediminis]
VVSLKTVLSDGSEVEFKSLSKNEFERKLNQSDFEGSVYREIFNSLSISGVKEQIKSQFPKNSIHRRNTGYAIDELIKTNAFQTNGPLFNMCDLLCGSEGTLAFTTEITLQLDDLPPNHGAMIAIHYKSVSNCLRSVAPLMKMDLYACEMMDKTILDCTRHNREQQENRSFIVGDPKAILMCEVRSNSSESLENQIKLIIEEISSLNLSYASIILKGDDINKANELRKAGLGLLGNLIGDEKSVPCIEDTAVAVEDLADYIDEFTELMNSFNQSPIYYAHAGAGELHLRPIVNMKTSKGVKDFKEITFSVAELVKKYQGSMSGEHGDGIVRSGCIDLMIGKENYEILKKIKTAFDPNNIFNPGKIVNPKPMDENLRYVPDRTEPNIETTFDFSDSLGILREAEKCNGSGDCRKLVSFGGTMCPSYRATRNEKDTTRARANALREVLTNSTKENKFDHHELKEVFDLCLSCKGCSRECPSSVDVSTLKSEFLHQYHKSNPISRRDWLLANNTKYLKWASNFSKIYNAVVGWNVTSNIMKWGIGLAKERSIPKLSNITLRDYYTKHYKSINNPIKTVYLFVDEFTNYLESHIGIDTIELLRRLNYEVKIVDHDESGRSFISKGVLEKAKICDNRNIEIFKGLITKETPLIGIEPSAILTFKDEYPKLVTDKDSAKQIGNYTFLIDDFIDFEYKAGNILTSSFNLEEKHIVFHGHCHQKALADPKSSLEILDIPKNYKVERIPSGCCGMAGSFGLEKEHYEISMTIGEQTLFPTIRKNENSIIAANGTSCRHQIYDGTRREALHPISILRRALL